MTATSRSLRLPDRTALSRALAPLLEGDRRGRGLRVVSRRRFIQASTFASEILVCRLGDGRLIRLLCKYDANLWEGASSGDGTWGYRWHYKRGVPHEGAVYREVIEPLGVTAPKFYGLHYDEASGLAYLVLEYLADAKRMAAVTEVDALSLAARWAGRFHALAESRIARASLRFLRRFDSDYYRAWVRRTEEFSGDAAGRHKWLGPIARRRNAWVPLLLRRATVIHGEYYGKNLLFHDGRIYPVDWESAAIAAGEIDLATLTEGWPAETIERAEREYARARWPAGEPRGFRRRLWAARLFNAFRWLGDQPTFARSAEARVYFDELRAAGEGLGLV